MHIKQALIGMLPAAVREPARNLYRQLRWGRLTNEEIFTRIYRDRLWGRNGASPYGSGDGSAEALAAPYVAAVARLLRERDVRSVVDVGCGDFRVGALLVRALPELDYTGIDVVGELIEYNNAHHGGPRVRFLKCDVTRDELPRADACLVRQVFQHLSNAQIAAALGRMRGYRCLVITESHPLQLTEAPNLDKPPGPSVRHHSRTGSGVYPEAPPFNLPATRVLELRRDDPEFPEVLTTYCVDRSAA